MPLADVGVENRNGTVDALIESGLLRRVLAMTEICLSSSLIEAWWRSLEHNWLFLCQLDSVAKFHREADLQHGHEPAEYYLGKAKALEDRTLAERDPHKDNPSQS